jgi:3D (Asp-Asp-Asp) domain-containing protein
VYTHVESVAELLTEQGVELSEGDRLTPDPSTPLRDGLAVSVTRVNEVIEYESTPIPFSTIYRDDPSMPQGENVVVQAGVDGYVQHEYAVVIENGQEVSRELLSDTIVAPDHRIVAQGTAVVAAAVAEPDTTALVAETEGGSECARPLSVWATWYTAASAGGSGRTATGTTVHKGTVAVDPRVIPLGTRMHIPGYGYGVAEDTGGAIIGNKIDLGYGANDVYDWSSGYVDICLLN